MGYIAIIITSLLGIAGIIFKSKKDDSNTIFNTLTWVGWLSVSAIFVSLSLGLFQLSATNAATASEKAKLIQKNFTDSIKQANQNFKDSIKWANKTFIDSNRSATTIALLRNESSNDSLRFGKTIERFEEVLNRQGKTFKELDRMNYPFKVDHFDIGIEFPINDSSSNHYYRSIYPSGDFFSVFGLKNSKGTHELFESSEPEHRYRLPESNGLEKPFGDALANVVIKIDFIKNDNKTTRPDYDCVLFTHLTENKSWTSGGKIVNNRFLYVADHHFLLSSFDLKPEVNYSAETVISVRDFNNALIKVEVQSSSSQVKPRVSWLRIYNTDQKFLFLEGWEHNFVNNQFTSILKLPLNNPWHAYENN